MIDQIFGLLFFLSTFLSSKTADVDSFWILGAAAATPFETVEELHLHEISFNILEIEKLQNFNFSYFCHMYQKGCRNFFEKIKFCNCDQMG